jgi:hypothetical protein
MHPVSNARVLDPNEGGNEDDGNEDSENGDDGNGDDRARLRRFVVDVLKFLNTLVEEGQDEYGNQLFYEDLVEPMREAWADVQQQFEVVDQGIRSTSGSALREHGLLGGQLRFKLLVIGKRFQQFWAHGGKELLKWLLESY